MSNIEIHSTSEAEAKLVVKESSVASAFQPGSLKEVPDMSFSKAILYQVYKNGGGDAGLDCTLPGGNRIILTGPIDIEALKRTTIYLKGKNNRIVIDGLRNVAHLDIACISSSTVSLKSPHSIREMTIVSSQGGRVEVGSGCLISRNVLLYSSKAHAIYGVADGSRRSRDGIEIGDRVWLGQGIRVLAGARVGNGSIIGSYSVLAGKIANNCAAAGNPCRVTTRNIFWTGKAVPGGNYFDWLRENGKPTPHFVRMTEGEV